jgi:hypothetical protein
VLAQKCRIAEASMGCGGCVVRRNAGFHLLLPAQVQVKLHLFLELTRHLIPAPQHPDAP